MRQIMAFVHVKVRENDPSPLGLLFANDVFRLGLFFCLGLRVCCFGPPRTRGKKKGSAQPTARRHSASLEVPPPSALGSLRLPGRLAPPNAPKCKHV